MEKEIALRGTDVAIGVSLNGAVRTAVTTAGGVIGVERCPSFRPGREVRVNSIFIGLVEF